MDFLINEQRAWCYTGGKTFDPSLPTLLFMHGAQNDHSVFALQTRYFAHHGYSVLAPDLPAHGRSQGAPLSSIEEMASWLIALLQAAKVQRVHLVGHSMGSLIALETAARLLQDPSLGIAVSHLSLLGTAFPMKVSDTLLTTARDDQMSAIDMVNQWSYSGIAQKPSCPAPGFYVPGAALRLKQRIAKNSDYPVFYLDFCACNQYTNGEQAASVINVPTLFLIATQDLMTPERATNLLRSKIANQQTVKIEKSGHDMMAEQPDAVLDALAHFAKA